VLQSPDFWWKRIERRTVPTSWLGSIITAVGDFVGRILAKIGELIGQILGSLFGIFRGGSSGGTLAVWTIVALLFAWSVWKLVPVIVRWLGEGAPTRSAQHGVTWHALAEAAALFEQAGQAFREREYAEAIRLALLALIARLEKLGLLRYDTTRTNREYQRELRHMSDLAATFGQLARIYERAWYGRVAPGRGDAELAIRLCGSVINREDLAPE
jgi:hypothetical protein